jgi:hypothetical protein
MNLILRIPDEALPALRAKASGVPLETFAEQVLLERIQDVDIPHAGLRQGKDASGCRAYSGSAKGSAA